MEARFPPHLARVRIAAPQDSPGCEPPGQAGGTRTLGRGAGVEMALSPLRQPPPPLVQSGHAASLTPY